MSYKLSAIRSSFAFTSVFSILLAGVPALAQDLVQVSDITGGSSVFVLRSSSRPSRRFTSAARSTRTRTQRLETAKKIKKQYEALAQDRPNRIKAPVITPDKIPTVKSMSSDKASTLFAGVGEYYLTQNDTDNALKIFREALDMNADNIKAKEGLSDALAAKGNEELLKEKSTPAKTFFQESLKFNPKNSAAYFGLGEAFTDLNQEKDAIANYESALANGSDLTEIYVPLGVLYFQAGEIAKADIMLTKATAGKSATAETQLFLGMIRLSQNRNDEALAAFGRAKALDPQSAEAVFQTGEAFTRLDRIKDAIGEYRKAVVIKPNYFDAWLALGDGEYSEKNYSEAIAAYRQATKIKNSSAEAYAGLGDALRMSGTFDEAAGNYNLAALFTTQSPNYNKDTVADFYSKIGYSVGQQCQVNMRKNAPCNWPDAIRALEKALELGSGNTADFTNLGWAYFNAARIDGKNNREVDRKAKLELARVNLTKAVAANPSYVEGPLLNLGMVLIDLGDYRGAIDALTKATQKQPKWAFALNELGAAYFQQKNYKEASNYFRKATDTDDNFVFAHYNLGEAEFRSGNKGAAMKAAEKLKKLGRKDLALRLELMASGAVRK